MLHLAVAVSFLGIAILLGVLGVVRGLFRSSIFQAPDIPCGAAKVSSDKGHKRANRSQSIAGHICLGDK
jgi:hypothetical protein